MVQTAGPALERKADVAAFLTALEPGTSSSSTRSTAWAVPSKRPSTRRWRITGSPVVLGQGAGARTVTLDLPRFTLIGATTRDRAC